MTRAQNISKYIHVYVEITSQLDFKISTDIMHQNHSPCIKTTRHASKPLVMYQKHLSCIKTTDVMYQNHLSCTKTTCHVSKILVMYQNHSSCIKTTCHASKPLIMHQNHLSCIKTTCHAWNPDVRAIWRVAWWRVVLEPPSSLLLTHSLYFCRLQIVALSLYHSSILSSLVLRMQRSSRF